MASPASSLPAPSARGRALALWTVLAAQLMLQMDFLIVLVALPRIQQDLGFTTVGLSWAPNAFALTFGGLLLLGGRLGDMIGQVRVFRIGLIIFVLASLLGGLAPNPALFITARVLQGVGAALAGPSIMALITRIAQNEAERRRGLSLFIAISSVGASAGLVLGGVLTELLSWRWSLLVNVPVGAVVVVLIGRLIAETRSRPARLDVGGALTATLGSVSLVYAFISAAEAGWFAWQTLGSAALAAALLTAFLRLEARHPEPLLDLSLLRSGTRLAALAVMALNLGMHSAMLFLLVQYLQRVMGMDPLFAGLAYLPLMGTVFVFSQFAPSLIARVGTRTLLAAGSLLVAASMVGFAGLDEASRYAPDVLAPLLVHAVGLAFVLAPATVAIMDKVPDHQAGAASGLLQMDQQVGGALGIAVIAAVYVLGSRPDRFMTGLANAYFTAAVIAVLAALIAWRGVSGSKPRDIAA